MAKSIISLLPLTDEEIGKFQARLRRMESGCLLWTGSKTTAGYGNLSVRGIPLYAHRVAFLLGGGVIDASAPCVLHHCDTRSCCEFTHLYAGTKADNGADVARRRRGRKSRRGLPFGVSRSGKKFMVTVRLGAKMKYFGTFPSVEEASKEAEMARALNNSSSL